LIGKVRIVSISSALSGFAALALATGAAIANEPVAGNPLIEIPAGPFVFGNNNGIENERPSRVIVGQGFAMNRTEIANVQYKRFIEATGHRPAFYANHPLLGLDDRPVVGVSWDDAAAFCAYYGLRLPSEQEYERAARGTDGMPFPWGTAPLSATRVNGGGPICCGADDSDGYSMTAPVDSFGLGASPEGVLNLVGNVWEWTRDLYAPYKGEGDLEVVGKYRVLRGGAWNSDPGHLTTTYRLAYASNFRFAANGGFRCVRSP
jgi:iron(II)-dependent oxidoreductase